MDFKNPLITITPSKITKTSARTLSKLGVASLLAIALGACSSEKKPETPAATASAETAPMAACGDVSIANMNWQSAEFFANLDKAILSKGYGCNVELLPGDTVPTATSMTEKGRPDIAPELWLSAIKETIEKGVSEKRIATLNSPIVEGGVEGWWIPKYLADAHPEIKTIDDALAHPELFAESEGGKGIVYGCPAGWACQDTTSQAFKAYGAKDKGFTLKDPGSAAGLDGSIAKAYQRKENWLGYYWSPTSILGKYEMVRLEAGVPFDQAEWDRCNSNAKCADPKKNDWEKSKIVTGVTERFKNEGGVANEYLNKRSLDTKTVNEMLSWMSDNQATGEDAAKHFLKEHKDIWTAWVSEDAAKKIAEGL